MERTIERLLYISRWMLAPLYLGLSLAILLLGIKFFQELIHVFSHILEVSEAELVLVILGLIDLSLVGGLLIMVMFSGYENFVSRLDSIHEERGLSWVVTMDSEKLKHKVAGSIVAISSIHLLQVFMSADTVANDKIFWFVVLHLTFVASAFAMGILDKLARKPQVPQPTED